jgi:uncharacterized protein (TIGR02118 family)
MADADSIPIYLFALYRWDGTTPEQFRDHYMNHHFDIGKRIPGSAWWYTFLNRDPQRSSDGVPNVVGAPKPDAFSILAFQSEEALATAPESPAWAEANLDNQDFVGAIDFYQVERISLVREGERPLGAGAADPQSQPIYLFGLYRWAGTSPEEFKAHYLDKHVELGKRMPGAVWYYTFLNKDPQRGQEGAPRPDAFAVLAFESEEALAAAPESDVWQEAMQDNIGFVSHFDTYSVERITVVPEKAPELSH